jgi:hypothetical protein
LCEFKADSTENQIDIPHPCSKIARQSEHPLLQVTHGDQDFHGVEADFRAACIEAGVSPYNESVGGGGRCPYADCWRGT